MKIILICCADKNNGIGYKDKLLFNFPKDMKYFRDKTMGHTVVYGRKTFDSMGHHLLEGRLNYIMSRDPWYDVEGAKTFTHPEMVIEIAEAMSEDELYIIGGGEIYELFMPYYTHLLITEVDAEAKADAFLPDISNLKLSDVNLLDEGATKEGHTGYFMEYLVER